MQYPTLVTEEYPIKLHFGSLEPIINVKRMQKQEGRIQGNRQGEGRRGGNAEIIQVDERVWERKKVMHSKGQRLF